MYHAPHFVHVSFSNMFRTPFSFLDQTIMEEANALQTSAVEGSRTTLDESVMPPPSSQRGLKRKAQDTEPALPVSPGVSQRNTRHPPFSVSDVTPYLDVRTPITTLFVLVLFSLCPLFSVDGSFGTAATATRAAGVQRL